LLAPGPQSARCWFWCELDLHLGSHRCPELRGANALEAAWIGYTEWHTATPRFRVFHQVADSSAVGPAIWALRIGSFVKDLSSARPTSYRTMHV